MTLEIGVTPWRLDSDDPEWLHRGFAEQAVSAEALGFHSIWLPESHFVERGAVPAPLLLLAAAAARTTRIRLGTTSYLLPVRHPLLVAEEVAVLEQISGGRVILGVGRGFHPVLFQAFGVPVAEKRERFEAALDAIRGAWRGKPLESSRAARLTPLPQQQPHPPLWVAAFGPRALAQAGRLNLPYLASPLESLAQLLENHAIHRGARPADANEPLPVPVMRSVFVARELQAVARVREALQSQREALARRGERWLGRTVESVGEGGELIGTPDQVREGIQSYRRALGLTHLIARTAVPGATAAELEHSVELLATLNESRPAGPPG
ncbi:MAG: LLM class flavin-dependent oxidoreductase [Myxococcota bacterium]